MTMANAYTAAGPTNDNPARIQALMSLVRAANERHWRCSVEAIPGVYGVWDPDMSVGNWCGCGKWFCKELEALEALGKVF